MGDEQIGDVFLRLQLQQQPQDAVGDQRIERAGNFVADDQLGPGGKRPGDADALLLAARQLRRIAVDETLAELDLVEQLDDALVALAAADAEIEVRAAGR